MDRLQPRNRLEPADAGRDALGQFLLADRIRLMYAHRLAPFARLAAWVGVSCASHAWNAGRLWYSS
jgi:hypothetical protein